MTLNEFRLKNNLSYENLGRVLNFTTNKAYRLCLNPGKIKLLDASKIIQQTKGEVSMQDLLSKC
jgi:hypothetical protein